MNPSLSTTFASFFLAGQLHIQRTTARTSIFLRPTNCQTPSSFHLGNAETCTYQDAQQDPLSAYTENKSRTWTCKNGTNRSNCAATMPSFHTPVKPGIPWKGAQTHRRVYAILHLVDRQSTGQTAKSCLTKPITCTHQTYKGAPYTLNPETPTPLTPKP